MLCCNYKHAAGILQVDDAAAQQPDPHSTFSTLIITTMPTLPPDTPKNRFPKSRISAGKNNGKSLNRRQYRIEANRGASLPWDTPLFKSDQDAIRRWEKRQGIKFIPGCDWAEVDIGEDG